MSHLISASELAAVLEDVTVLDVRWALTASRPTAPDGTPLPPVGRAEYEQGHVPGAFFVDLDTELADAPGDGGRHPLPDPAVVEAVLRRCGIDHLTDPVVVLDGRDSFAAARAWWVLRWVGMTDVRVLDGGYAAWVRAGLPVTAVEPTAAEGVVTVRPGALPTLDARGAAAHARTGLLLDVRAPERYRGEQEPLDPVAGHIPGAVNSPSAALLAPDGTFRRDLAAHLAGVLGGGEAGRGPGSVGDRPVGVYCGSGVTAAHHALALAELGVDTVLYPGSWSEWIRDPSRPVATGPDA